MNKKIIMSLGIMFLFGLTMVSASIDYENVDTDYNKKDNIVTNYFDAVLNNQCSVQSIRVVDHKGNVVGSYSEAGAICAICYGNRCYWFGQHNGVVKEVHDIELIAKKDIKGLGNLRLEIFNPRNGAVAYSERIK